MLNTEVVDYFTTVLYNTIPSDILTCSQNLMASQLNLPHGNKNTKYGKEL